MYRRHPVSPCVFIPPGHTRGSCTNVARCWKAGNLAGLCWTSQNTRWAELQHIHVFFFRNTEWPAAGDNVHVFTDEVLRHRRGHKLQRPHRSGRGGVCGDRSAHYRSAQTHQWKGFLWCEYMRMWSFCSSADRFMMLLREFLVFPVFYKSTENMFALHYEYGDSRLFSRFIVWCTKCLKIVRNVHNNFSES